MSVVELRMARRRTVAGASTSVLSWHSMKLASYASSYVKECRWSCTTTTIYIGTPGTARPLGCSPTSHPEGFVTIVGVFRGLIGDERGLPYVVGHLPMDVVEDVGVATLVQEHRPRVDLEVVVDHEALVHLPRERHLANAALAGDGHERMP